MLLMVLYAIRRIYLCINPEAETKPEEDEVIMSCPPTKIQQLIYDPYGGGRGGFYRVISMFH